ncbi:MAG: DUF1365 domain-containing protein [Steroidobacteraceae bacterium]
MDSALYIGWLKHRRRGARVHAFRYPLFMVLLDLAELDRVFKGRWLWGVERRTVAAFRRADHLGDARVPLAQSVRELVQRECGLRLEGPVRLLTHLRYFGYCFNPVSFYYCFDVAGENVVAVVAEVNNTPWGEQHCYVLDAQTADRSTPLSRWRTPKRMHVSPFMPMDLQYEWALAAPRRRLQVQMRCRRDGATVFEADLALRRRELTGGAMALTLLRYPWMTARVIAAIHWQALLLWFKRVPYHAHPAATSGTTKMTGPVV